MEFYFFLEPLYNWTLVVQARQLHPPVKFMGSLMHIILTTNIKIDGHK